MNRSSPDNSCIDWDLCRDVARSHGRSFFLASQCLPRDQRRAIHATYAYCRLADDLIDDAPRDGEATAAHLLDLWEAQLGDPVHPVAVAFAETRAAYGVPAAPAHELLEGLRMD